jgi:hypothetical protein
MKLKILLILNLFAITAFGQYGAGTNNLWSVSNNLTHFKYDGSAFTNTVNFKPISTNVFAFKIHYGDSTNEYIGVIATNNALYFVSSNNLETARNFLIISNDVAGGITLYTDAGLELGQRSNLGNTNLPWKVWELIHILVELRMDLCLLLTWLLLQLMYQEMLQVVLHYLHLLIQL